MPPHYMYTGAALGFGLIRACRSGLVLYCSVLSDAGGENDGSSAIFERSLLYYCLFFILPCSVVSLCNSFGNAAATARATDSELYGYLTTWEGTRIISRVTGWHRYHYSDVIMSASVSHHQPHDCLLNRLFRRRSKKTSKLRVTDLCEGNSPVTSEFPAQRASDAENVSICWRHYGDMHH